MQRLRPWLHDVVHRLGDGESSELQYKFDKAGRNRLELTGGVLEVAHDNCWRHADNYDLDKENISLILGPGCCGPAYNHTYALVAENETPMGWSACGGNKTAGFKHSP